MKVTDLFEAKRVPSDKGYYTPGYDEDAKQQRGTVKDWMARMDVKPADIKDAMAQAKELPSYAAIADSEVTTAGESKNGTFSFRKPGEKADKYMVYANGLIRGSSMGGWNGEARPTRMASPKPRLVAGSPVKSLVKIYDGAFKELAKKMKKRASKVNEGKTGDFKDSKEMLAVVNSVMPKVSGLDL